MSTRAPVVLDLETKKTFKEAPDPKNLGISVVGLYDYGTDTFSTFLENELGALFSILENASITIGFNLDGFDMQVLQAYYPGDIKQFHTFDILTDVKRILGRRLSLNELAKATLNEGKSGNGLQAITYFKQKKWDELKKYCLDDVRITRDLFNYGINESKLYYNSPSGKRFMTVAWGKYWQPDTQTDLHLTLPF